MSRNVIILVTGSIPVERLSNALKGAGLKLVIEAETAPEVKLVQPYKPVTKPGKKKKRRLTAEGRRLISEAVKRRWAKQKRLGK